MNLNVELEGEVAVVTVPLESLDADNAKEFKKEISPVLENYTKVLLDLRQLQFVDSSGLGAILSSLRALTAKDGDLKLYGVTKKVRALFELVRMHRLFEIFNTREEGIQAF